MARQKTPEEIARDKALHEAAELVARTGCTRCGARGHIISRGGGPFLCESCDGLVPSFGDVADDLAAAREATALRPCTRDKDGVRALTPEEMPMLRWTGWIIGPNHGREVLENLGVVILSEAKLDDRALCGYEWQVTLDDVSRIDHLWGSYAWGFQDRDKP